MKSSCPRNKVNGVVVIDKIEVGSWNLSSVHQLLFSYEYRLCKGETWRLFLKLNEHMLILDRTLSIQEFLISHYFLI